MKFSANNSFFLSVVGTQRVAFVATAVPKFDCRRRNLRSRRSNLVLEEMVLPHTFDLDECLLPALPRQLWYYRLWMVLPHSIAMIASCWRFPFTSYIDPLGPHLTSKIVKVVWCTKKIAKGHFYIKNMEQCISSEER